uniref:Uncharacterized protein n=1 Tax=Physcomitrium patens TaxID=3218 RepID=A0A2K1JGN2_PHYPA|nr:hypothetical protein PHYPA_018091 [Physcomitrium patens]
MSTQATHIMSVAFPLQNPAKWVQSLHQLVNPLGSWSTCSMYLMTKEPHVLHIERHDECSLTIIFSLPAKTPRNVECDVDPFLVPSERAVLFP